MTTARTSDRWMTPGVVVALVLGGVVIVLAVLACVTYVTVRGFDPQPVVQLAGTLVAAASAMGTFIVQLVSRRGVAKVERQTGRLATGVGDVLVELDAARGRHAPREETERPPPRPGANHGQVTGANRGHGREPSDEDEGYSDTPDPDLQDTAWYRQ